MRGLHRILLRLYPKGFRQRFEREMLETADAVARGPLRRRRLRSLIDLVVNSIAVRAEDRAERAAVRQSDGSPWAGLTMDLRLALRTFRREPSFSAFIVITLGLSIGANAALFGIADRLLLRGPDHIRDAGRVARVYLTARPDGMREHTTPTVGHVTYAILRQARTIEAAATHAVNEASLGRGSDAKPASVGFVSASYFPLAGVTPALGRFFTEREESPATLENVAVISHALWHREYGGSAETLTRGVVINDESYRIVGIAPRGFTGATLQPVDAWIPMNIYSRRVTADWMNSWDAQWMSIVVRLRSGVSSREAEAELTGLFRAGYSGAEPYMAQARVWTAGLSAADDGREPIESRVVRWLAGVAAIVLLIACINITNLLLARAAHRLREVAIRLAIGASRARVVRAIMVESLFLSLAGTVVGLLLGSLIGSVARASLLDHVDWSGPAVDGRVIAASTAIAIGVGLFVAFIPALTAIRSDITPTLRRGARGGGGQRLRLRAALTIAQAALSVALLIPAVLFVRSLWNAKTINLGMDPRQVLVAEVNRAGLARITDTAARDAERLRRQRFLTDVLDRVQSIPGIERASVAVGLPFGNRFSIRVRAQGMASLPRVKTGGPTISAVSSGYFDTIGTRVLRGRAFTDADRAGTHPVAIVNDFMARTVWTGSDPLGQCLLLGDGNPACTTIVGIAENTNRARLTEDPRMHVYIPVGHERALGFGGAVLLVRNPHESSSNAEAIRRALVTADPSITFVRTQVLSDRIDPLLRPWELGVATFLFAGVLAIVVATVGVYSVIAFLVSDRRHEIGVRLALGASRISIMGMVLKWAIGMAATGVLAGMLIAGSVARFVEPLLFSVSARDPWVFAGVAAGMLLVAILAAVRPADSAQRISPLEALRSEH